MSPIYAQYKDSNYLISRFGTIRTLDKFKLLKQEKHYRGHMKIGLSLNGKPKKFFVHRLVAECFVTKPRKKDHNIVNHLDANKTNNYCSNLEWTTISGNTKHAYDMGLINLAYARSCKKNAKPSTNIN